VVGLGEDRESILGQALDEVDLPQRTVPVEGARHDPGDELFELRVGARPREGGAADVVADVEVLVVDPHRVGRPRRDRL
jgi:hypothetical protein